MRYVVHVYGMTGMRGRVYEVEAESKARAKAQAKADFWLESLEPAVAAEIVDSGDHRLQHLGRGEAPDGHESQRDDDQCSERRQAPGQSRRRSSAR